MESVSLLDAAYSARLSVAGLPALANVEAEKTGVASSVDPYKPSSSTLTQLSGYGQLLSTASRTADGLQSLLGANTNLASGYDSAVITANASAGTAAGDYSVEVSKIAKPQVLQSGVFADQSSQILSTGTFSIAVGSNTPVNVTINEGSGLISDVSYPWGSLKGIAASINSAGAGVSASVESNEFGYFLKLQANTTGTANTVSFTASADSPFSAFGSNFAKLGLAQTQAAQDAEYKINGGTTQSSASNSAISLTSGATFNIVTQVEPNIPTTVTVGTTPVVAADTTSVSTAASTLVQNLNLMMGTISQLTASTGALSSGTATTTSLTADLGTAISSLGTLVTTNPTTGSLAIDNTALSLANTTSTASLLTSVATTLYNSLSNYLGESGSISTQAKTLVPDLVMVNNQLASSNTSYSNLSSDLKQYLLQKSINSASIPTGLPESVFTS